MPITWLEWLCFVSSTVSLVVISLTMLARANDQRFRRGWRWQLRLVGFMLAGAAPVGIVGAEWRTEAWPSIYEAIFRLGLACVFFTTPGQPPWHKFITKGTSE